MKCSLCRKIIPEGFYCSYTNGLICQACEDGETHKAIHVLAQAGPDEQLKNKGVGKEILEYRKAGTQREVKFLKSLQTRKAGR